MLLLYKLNYHFCIEQVYMHSISVNLRLFFPPLDVKGQTGKINHSIWKIKNLFSEKTIAFS